MCFHQLMCLFRLKASFPKRSLFSQKRVKLLKFQQIPGFCDVSLCSSPFSKGGIQGGDECFEVAFGLPWDYEKFVQKAVKAGHPTNFCKLVPADIQEAIGFHAQQSASEVSEYRLNWCKRWLSRAAQLDRLEKDEAACRHPATSRKRLRLTKEILQSLQYEDVEALKLLEQGSSLAGEVENSAVFQSTYRPCIANGRTA